VAVQPVDPGGGGARTGRAPLRHRRLHVALAGLCLTEVTSWGVLYYAFPVLAGPISANTGWPRSWLTAGFSASLVVAAVTGIGVGRLLDRRGPRLVMTAGSVLGVAAVVVLASAPSLVWFVAGWLLAGLAMAGTFYQPAFAALTRWYGARRVRALTTLTLAGGLASTCFAPLTGALAEPLGWRHTYLLLAAVLAAITIPAHAVFLRLPWPAATTPHHQRTAATGIGAVLRGRAFLALAAAITLGAFAQYAALIGLVPLLTGRGMPTVTAALLLGVGGLGQVAGRLGYATLARHTRPATRATAILAAAAVVTALLGLIPGPVLILAAGAVAAGAVRGVFTLLQATAVADRWGTHHYATLTAVLAAPAMAASALAPWAGTTLATALGGYPHLFIALATIALIAAAVAAGSTPRPAPDR
jgi:MFS family permease